MAVNDILLLSDLRRELSDHVMADEPGDGRGENGTSTASTEKGHCCGSYNRQESVVLETRQKAIEKVIYYSACAEQSSEHPIAKGISPNIV